MLKKALHKGFSVIMALLVLLSTTSFTVDKHYCGDVLIDTAVFSEAKKCPSMACDKKQEDLSKKRCCKNELEVVEGQDQLKISKVEELSFQQQTVLAAYLFSYVNVLEELPKLIVPHRNYSPPDLTFEIHILDEVFLI